MDDDAIRTETRGGDHPVEVHVCNDCRAWSRKGEPLRHSKRCDTPDAQPAIDDAALAKADRKTRALGGDVKRIQRLAKAGEISKAGLTEDEIVDAVDAGIISASDAMNRDF